MLFPRSCQCYTWHCKTQHLESIGCICHVLSKNMLYLFLIKNGKINSWSSRLSSIRTSHSPSEDCSHKFTAHCWAHNAPHNHGHPDASDEENHHNFKKNGQPTSPFCDVSSKSCGSLQFLWICQRLCL